MEEKLRKKNDNTVEKLNSITVAIMIATGCITGVLVRISALSKVPNNVIVLGLCCLFIFAQFIYTKKLNLPIAALFVMVLIFILYALTLLFNSRQCDMTTIQFIFYGIVPIFVISQKIDGELVLRYSLYLSLITLPVINSFFTIQYEQYGQAYMGNVYSVLTPAIIAIIHFKLYRKSSNLLTKAAYIYNLYVLIQVFLFANRGAVLCVLFCVMVMLINSYNDETRKKLPPLKIIFILIVCFVSLLIIINALPLLESLSAFCQSNFHNVPSFISKMIKYLSEGDVSDGRTNISDFTMNAIMDKPLFGHGIKTFEAYAGEIAGKKWPYPHQYILQFLFEGGLVFALVPIYLTLSLTAKVVFTRIKNKKEFAICCALVCINIPKLLISTEPWSSTGIWMLVTYSLIYIFKTNNYFMSFAAKFTPVKNKTEEQ